MWLLSRWNGICLLGRRIFSLSAHKDQPSESVSGDRALVIECLSNLGVFSGHKTLVKIGKLREADW